MGTKGDEGILKRINQLAKEAGIPIKKIMDFLFILRTGNPVENDELLQRVGISKKVINQVKKLLSSFLKPTSKNTQLVESAISEIKTIFGPDYKPEETLWTFLKNEDFKKSIKLVEKYSAQRPSPDRKYDQFTATIETTARRASLLNFFEDVKGKKLLFLGDDDFTSVAVTNLHTALNVSVLDIDDRILDKIKHISQTESLEITTNNYDARKSLPPSYFGKFDVVFTDPPYTTEGIKLFVSKAIQALDLSNQTAKIYICYGNSDRAKERFLPIYEIFGASGLMIRWMFDKFNRYQGAESIGSASSLFILEVTPKTKPFITGNYDRPIYTNN